MTEETQIISIDLIDEPAAAMRTDIPRDAIFDLGADIKRNGLINPITVRPRADRFEVVAGHRRYLAHRYTGIPTIRCIVRELTDAEAFAVMTSENLKREDVNPVDEAVHASRAVEFCGGDLDAAAKMCGESRYWVETRLAISAMDEPFKDALRAAKIKLGVALELSKIDNETDRATALEQAISQGQSLVMAQYVVAQHRAKLWGQNAFGNGDANGGASMPPTQVMLRCAIADKEYPAESMRSILVAVENLGYIEAMREHLKKESATATPSPSES